MSFASIFSTIESDILGLFSRAETDLPKATAALTTLDQYAGEVFGLAEIAAPQLAATGAAGAAVAAAVPEVKAAYDALKADVPALAEDVGAALTRVFGVAVQVMDLAVKLGPYFRAVANDAETIVAQVAAVSTGARA